MIGLTPEQLLFLLRGFGWTIVLSLLAFAGGGVLGFVLALTRVYAPRPLRVLAMLYIRLIQGTPLLILLFLTYFGLPALGLVVDPLVAAAIGLSTYVVGLPGRDLARQPGSGAAHAGGGRRLPGAERGTSACCT